MAQRSYFFDSVAGDRIYTSADFARVFGAIAGRDGVIYGYGDELAVSPGTGMNVTVGTGAAFVQGRMLEVYDQAETLPIATADATNPRIDRVVVRVDLSISERRAYLAVKVGTPAATPAAPLLQQDSTIWELSLAQVRVGAGATGIVVEDITDEREYTSLATDRLLAHLADANNPHSVTAAQVPYTSSIYDWAPGDVATGLDVLASERIIDHNLDVASPPNGYYVRWENGLQVCWLPRLTLPKQSSTQARAVWTFPAAFVDTNYSVHITQMWAEGDNVAHKVTMAFSQTRLTSRCTPTLASKDDDLADGESWGVHLVAIGRWK